MFFILHVIAYYATFLTRSFSERITTKSIEQLMINYEYDRNSLVAVTEKADEIPFEDFYEEIDPRVGLDVHSINTIYFGPTWAFMRLDTESILHILINTNRKMIPISRVLLAWDLVTDGLTAAFLQGREYIAFGELLELVPEEDLYYVNFGDNSVLRYFANIDVELSARKYGILAAAYRRFYGTEWYRNGTYISELGYLICGFPSSDLARIRPDVLITINVDLFSKLRKCTRNQTMTLYQIATHHKAFGHPNKWTSNDVRKMEYLFTYIHESDISSITFEAVSAISAAVIRDLDDLKVLQFTKPQILTFNPPARREYILKMQYITNLPLDKISRVSKSNSVISIYIQMLLIVITLC